MATPRDKLARMAEGLARLNRESAERSAAAGPGRSITRALELSELVRRSDTNFEKPLPPSLPALWSRWAAQWGIEGKIDALRAR